MSTIQALRTQLLQVEQRIKGIGGDLKHALWRLDELSAEETKELRRLLEQRKQLLDDMMRPTPTEVKRLELQNKRLLQLYHELCTSVNWADGTLFHPAFRHINICYPLHVVCCHLLFSVPDVLRMDYFERHVEMELYRQTCMADETIKVKKGGEL